MNDLLEQGYPPRPDPVQNSAQYARWLRLVSTPADYVANLPVTNFSQRGGYVGSFPTNSWGAQAIISGAYVMSQATFTIPSSGDDGGEAYIWGGLGGIGITLIQDGVWFNTDGSTNLNYEYVQLDGSGNQHFSGGNTNLNPAVAAGDEMEVWAWPSSNSTGALSTSGRYGFFEMEDLTTGKYTTAYLLNTQSYSQFSGASAEVVIERPQGCTGSCGLTDYGSTWATGGAYTCSSGCGTWTYHDDYSDNWDWINLTSDGTNSGAALETNYFPGLPNSSNSPDIFFEWWQFE